MLESFKDMFAFNDKCIFCMTCEFAEFLDGFFFLPVSGCFDRDQVSIHTSKHTKWLPSTNSTGINGNFYYKKLAYVVNNCIFKENSSLNTALFPSLSSLITSGEQPKLVLDWPVQDVYLHMIMPDTRTRANGSYLQIAAFNPPQENMIDLSTLL